MHCYLLVLRKLCLFGKYSRSWMAYRTWNFSYTILTVIHNSYTKFYNRLLVCTLFLFALFVIKCLLLSQFNCITLFSLFDSFDISNKFF